MSTLCVNRPSIWWCHSLKFPLFSKTTILMVFVRLCVAFRVYTNFVLNDKLISHTKSYILPTERKDLNSKMFSSFFHRVRMHLRPHKSMMPSTDNQCYLSNNFLPKLSTISLFSVRTWKFVRNLNLFERRIWIFSLNMIILQMGFS